MRRFLIGACSLASMALAASAEAEIITTDYNFGGSSSGTMSLQYDSSTTSYTLSSLIFDFNSGENFTPLNTLLQCVGDFCQMGGAVGGSGFPEPYAYDFTFLFDPTLASQRVDMAFTVPGLLGVLPNSITITQAGVNGVPEPATWAMMLIGFGAVGFGMRRRRRTVNRRPQIA